MMKVMTVVGTRPEIIRLSRVIHALDRSVRHVLVHTGQNYDYELNQVFFEDLDIRKPDHFLEAAAPGAAETVGQIITRADAVLEKEQPDAFLVLGDTNSCLAAYPAKRRKVPIFHMEAGNRCVLTSGCPRRSTGGWWIICRTSTCPTARFRGSICCARGSRRTA